MEDRTLRHDTTELIVEPVPPLAGPPPRPQPSPAPAPRWWEWSRFVIGLCAFTVVAALAICAAWTVVVPLFTDQFPVVIVSGSMSPALKKGDVVLMEPSDGHGLAPPTVILYTTPGLDQFHRIIYVNPDGSYITKGDANNAPDAAPVRPEQVKGFGRTLVPFLAIALVWAREGEWLLVALWVLVVTLALCGCPWGLSDRYDPWLLAEARRKASPDRQPADAVATTGRR